MNSLTQVIEKITNLKNKPQAWCSVSGSNYLYRDEVQKECNEILLELQKQDELMNEMAKALIECVKDSINDKVHIYQGVKTESTIIKMHESEIKLIGKFTGKSWSEINAEK
jgi:hypothetical protein